MTEWEPSIRWGWTGDAVFDDQIDRVATLWVENAIGAHERDSLLSHLEEQVSREAKYARARRADQRIWIQKAACLAETHSDEARKRVCLQVFRMAVRTIEKQGDGTTADIATALQQIRHAATAVGVRRLDRLCAQGVVTDQIEQLESQWLAGVISAEEVDCATDAVLGNVIRAPLTEDPDRTREIVGAVGRLESLRAAAFAHDTRKFQRHMNADLGSRERIRLGWNRRTLLLSSIQDAVIGQHVIGGIQRHF